MSCCDGDSSRRRTPPLRLPCEGQRGSQSYQEGKVYKLRYIKILKSNSVAISEAPDNQSTNRPLLLPALPGDYKHYLKALI